MAFESGVVRLRTAPQFAGAVEWLKRLLVSSQRWARSSEPIQYFLCAFLGSFVGVLVAGLRRLVDFAHRASFHLPDGHTLSAGIGVDPLRIAAVPAIGGLVLGIAALIVRRFRSTDIVDPIEANALHGGRMSMIDSLRLLFSTVLSNAAGASVGMEAGYSQFGSSVFSPSASISAFAAPTSASSSPQVQPRPSQLLSTLRSPAPFMAMS
jgi:CIC family chloride channel protein